MPLGTGDYESLSHANPSIPQAPRTPVFNRSVLPPSSSMRPGAGKTYPAHYSPVPSAPNSLSPVAMGSWRNDPNGTGPQRAAETVPTRSRPNVKTGLAILLAGALIGGVMGITMRARQNAAEAFAAQQGQQSPAAQPPLPVAAVPVVIAPTTPAMGATTTSPPAFGMLPGANAPSLAGAPASAAVPATKEAKKAGHGKAAGSGHGASPMKAASKEKKDKDDGYRVASADSGNEAKEPKEPAVKESSPKESKEAKEPKEAKEKEPKEPKEAKAESKDPKGSKKSSNKAAADEAASVLKAAMGATENTL